MVLEVPILILDFFSPFICLKHYSMLIFASKIELVNEWPRSKIVWCTCFWKLTI